MKKIGTVLSESFADLALSDIKNLILLKKEWRKISGSWIEKESEPYAIYKDMLMVKVSNHVLGTQLIYYKQKIIDGSNKVLLKEVFKNVKVEIDADFFRRKKITDENEIKPCSDLESNSDTLDFADQIASTVKDPDLSKLIKRFIVKMGQIKR